MATEGAALAHLRDVYYILTHDLADIQLDVLRDSGTYQVTSLDLASKIAPVVVKLAIPMLDFNASVEAASQLTTTGMRQARLMIGLVITLMVLVVLSILLVLGFLTWNRYKEDELDAWAMIPEFGRILISALCMLAFLAVWLILIRSGRDEIGHNSDILKTGYWNVHNHVGAAYPIRFSAAMQQGTVSTFVLQQNGDQYGGSNLRPGPDCESDAEDTDQVPSCQRIIDPCGSTIPTLPEVITKSCPNEIFNMLDTLQTLKTGGVDSFDRRTMWMTISGGVDAIRRTIDVSANADTDTLSANSAPLDATAAQAVVDSKILPVMRRNELLSPSALSPGDVKYLYDAIKSDLLRVLQQIRYQVDVSDYRDYLDTSLSSFYKKEYPKIRSGLLSVVDEVQRAEDARPPPSSNMYVDPGTLIARVKDLGLSAWNDLIMSTDVTRAAVRQFLSKFKLPRDQPNSGVKIILAVSGILTVVGYMALFMYVTSTLHRVILSDLERQRAARYMIIAGCLYALLVVTFNSMVRRAVLRSDHNWSTITRNGQLLATYLDATDTTAAVIGGNLQSVQMADAQGYIDSATGVVVSYDACNSVTNGASTMPFPTMDIVINLMVVVVVMASALYGVAYLNPLDKLSNIRTVLRLRERVLNGDVPGGMEQQLICCTPNHSVWHITYWIAVAILFFLNIYVITNVQKTNDRYGTSVNMMPTCL